MPKFMWIKELLGPAKKNSYYYLSELLNLKYLVLMRKNKHEEAERYLNLAQQMKNVESGNL